MRVVYITDFYYTGDSGAKTSARAHLHTLQTLYGKSNIFVIALTGNEDTKDIIEGHIVYPNRKSNVSLFIQCLCGYTTYIDAHIVKKILCDIELFACDAVFIDNSIFGKLAKAIRKKFPCIGIVSYYHDVKAGLAIEWLKAAPIYRKPVFMSMLMNEKINQAYCDVNLVLNERENTLFEESYGRRAEGILKVYLDIPKIDCSEKRCLDKTLKILFVGGSYLPNVQGIRWFIDEVIPELKLSVELSVVGNNMEKSIDRESVPDNVKIFGRVENLGLVYAEADVVVEPIFEGAGMKVKTAEALAYGKIIIASDEALVGYTEQIPNELWEKKIFRANDVSEFVEAIEAVLEEYEHLYKFNTDVRKIYENNYSERYAKDVIVDAINKSVKGKKRK